MKNTATPNGQWLHMCPRLSVAVLAAVLMAGSALATTITVTYDTDSSNDDGYCTLREAILAANTDTASGLSAGECAAGSGADTIVFNIFGGGQRTLYPDPALPTITSLVHIDGYSQPGLTHANTLAVGNDAVIAIQLSGASAGGGAPGLVFGEGSNGSSVRGLAITGFSDHGILIDGGGGADSGNYTIAGNFIGLGAGGLATGNGGSGIVLRNQVSDTVIGGGNPADRNVISANAGSGIRIESLGSSTNTVRNNYIGTDPDGQAAEWNGDRGIHVLGADHTTLRDNLIGAQFEGILFTGGPGFATIVGNTLGVAVDGTTDIGGGSSGIQITSAADGTPASVTIGGTAAGEGNTIARWGVAGVFIDRLNAAHVYSTSNAIRGNSIHDNGLGIDLRDTATASGTGANANANDAGDADVGANQFQNYPVASAAVTDGATTAVTFALDTSANGDFIVDAYASPTCAGPGEGSVYLGSQTYAADGGGHVGATLSGLPATTVGQFVTLTATNSVLGDTSEFSACQAVVAGSPAPSAPPVDVQAVPGLSQGGLALASLLVALVGGLSRRAVRPVETGADPREPRKILNPSGVRNHE